MISLFSKSSKHKHLESVSIPLFLLLNSVSPSYWSLFFVIFAVPSSALVPLPHAFVPGPRRSHALALLSLLILPATTLAHYLADHYRRNLPKISPWSCHLLTHFWVASLCFQKNLIALAWHLPCPSSRGYSLSLIFPGSWKMDSFPLVPYANVFPLPEGPPLRPHPLPAHFQVAVPPHQFTFS